MHYILVVFAVWRKLEIGKDQHDNQLEDGRKGLIYQQKCG